MNKLNSSNAISTHNAMLLASGSEPTYSLTVGVQCRDNHMSCPCVYMCNYNLSVIGLVYSTSLVASVQRSMHCVIVSCSSA